MRIQEMCSQILALDFRVITITFECFALPALRQADEFK